MEHTDSSEPIKPSNDLMKPSTFGSLGEGWDTMKGNFLVFFLAVLVMAILDGPLSGNNNGSVDNALIGFIYFAYGLLFLPVMNYGTDLIFLKGVRGDEVKIKSIVDGFQKYLDVVLANLLVFGLIGISLVILIIPGIYVACRLAFVSYLVMDEDMDPVEAVEASWRLTDGHTLKILGLGLMAIPICILGLLMLIIGIFPALMWIKSSFASLYLTISDHEPVDLDSPKQTENGESKISKSEDN